VAAPFHLSAPGAFAEYVQARRGEIDAALLRALPRPPYCPERVAEAIRYSVEVGGKRLRPILTLASAESVACANGTLDEPARQVVRGLAMPAACAIELIHTYSLVHDDLPAMDNDSTRRGRPTLHVVYGDGLAILAGDGLLAQAFALLADEPDHEQEAGIAMRKLRVLHTIGQAVGAAGMVGGQAIDLESAGLVKGSPGGRLPLDADGLRDMHARKTGMLIRAAAVSGAIMAGGTRPQVEAIDRFAAEIGLVFQIIDDILDVEGTRETLGKTPGKDIATDKLTYPALHGLARSRELAAEGIARAEHALVTGNVPGDRLRPIAHWIADRRH
jgi:geranylgeranyl diphosphate synthase type II